MSDLKCPKCGETNTNFISTFCDDSDCACISCGKHFNVESEESEQ